nr:AAA family ATPase [uncultured Rhodopila sp.]
MADGTRPDGTPGKSGDRWVIQRLAAAVGVTEQTIYNWKSGRRLPDHTQLVALERELFGSNPDYDDARRELRHSYEFAVARRDAALPYEPLIGPDRCFGRDGDIDTLAAALTASPCAVVAVLGPPGVGKTTLTRKVAVSPPVTKHFGERRWFIPLEAATDAEALRTAIIAGIGLDPAYITFRPALDRLSRQASLLVLDNLETPWERDMAAVQDCLRQLAARQNVTVLVSLRGAMAPGGPVLTRQIVLDSLAPAEARRLFLDLAPRIPADDPDLERLLREFQGMPLAIELVAYRAAPFQALRDVWEEWQRTGLALATHPDQPDGRYTSVQRSIELSWQSLRLHEEGRRLFCMLGLLPGGMAKQHRTALMGEHVHDATRQLLATGLAFLRNHERLDLLPPIRAFAQGLPETAAIDRESLTSHYLDLGSDLLLRLTDENDRNFKRLQEDFKNVESSMLAGGDLSGRNLSPASIKALQDEIRFIMASQQTMTAAGRAKEQARLTRASSKDDAAKEAEQQPEIAEQKAISALRAATSRAMRILAVESRRASEQDRPIG